jgi:hypothetical protein
MFFALINIAIFTQRTVKQSRGVGQHLLFVCTASLLHMQSGTCPVDSVKRLRPCRVRRFKLISESHHARRFFQKAHFLPHASRRNFAEGVCTTI